MKIYTAWNFISFANVKTWLLLLGEHAKAENCLTQRSQQTRAPRKEKPRPWKNHVKSLCSPSSWVPLRFHAWLVAKDLPSGICLLPRSQRHWGKSLAIWELAANLHWSNPPEVTEVDAGTVASLERWGAVVHTHEATIRQATCTFGLAAFVRQSVLLCSQVLTRPITHHGEVIDTWLLFVSQWPLFLKKQSHRRVVIQTTPSEIPGDWQVSQALLRRDPL